MTTKISWLTMFSWFWSFTAIQAAETNALKFTVGVARPGFTALTPATAYNETTGFGFEPGAALTARGRSLLSDDPFLFSVKLAEGNYSVAIRLGNDETNSTTTVKAEARRLMIENARTAKGETGTREFTVNIRTPRIAGGDLVRLKEREKDSEMVTWDDKLTLEFNGIRPSVRTIEIVPATVPTVFLAGDSTVCDQPLEPWNSWGQMLPRFLKPGVAVANYAQSGESIKSSLSARRFEKIFNVMKRGDWLLMQFGHNDMKDRAPDALEQYRADLKSIVAQVRAKGGTPVLITSVERKGGVRAPTLAGYPDAVRSVSKEDHVALIDLHAMSVRLYRALGTNLSRAFQDGSHHNNYGSYELAKCVAAGIAAAKIDLAEFVLEEVKSFDPEHPDQVETFNISPSPTRSTAKPEGD